MDSGFAAIAAPRNDDSEMQSPAFRRGPVVLRRQASAAAIAALLAATLLAALAWILGLLAGLLSAALLLLAGLLLPTLLLLAIVALTLTRVLVLLRILTHGRSPVAQPPNRRGCRLKLTNT
jgi:fatty acid desaturase